MSISGTQFDRHLLIRTFSDELVSAGIGARFAEASELASKLDRGFGTNYQWESGKLPCVAMDDIPGHSLAATLAKASQEHIPFGVDQALSILHGLAQAVLDLHAAGASHGVITPHNIWLSYEGGTHLLDAPYAAQIKALLPKTPQLASAIADYQPPVSAKDITPLQQDLYAIGTILFELLTFQKLPHPDRGTGQAESVAEGRLTASLEDEPFPAEIRDLLGRLLLLQAPFQTAGEFNRTLESVLFDGDHAPTTFNAAFFLHTVFRNEFQAGVQARKEDEAADFSPFAHSASGPQTAMAKPDRSHLVRWGILGGVTAAAIAGTGVYIVWNKNREAQQYQAQVAQLQQELSRTNARMADVSAQEIEIKNREAELSREQAKAQSTEEKEKIQKLIDEEKRKASEIAKQKDAILKSAQDLRTRTQTITQLADLPRSAPMAVAPTPTIAFQPSVAPPVAPTPVAKPQPATSPVPAATTTTPTVDIPPSVLRAVSPITPRLHNPATLSWFKLRNQDLHILVKVLVDPAGRALKVLVVKGEDRLPDFEEAARNAALSSTYQPATHDGKPTSGWLTSDYNFQKPWLKR